LGIAGSVVARHDAIALPHVATDGVLARAHFMGGEVARASPRSPVCSMAPRTRSDMSGYSR
jgi:hypothetical protein